MAKTFSIEVAGIATLTEVTEMGPSMLFADSIIPTFHRTDDTTSRNDLIVTTNFEPNFASIAAAEYQTLSDDSQSEIAYDQSVGKFVEGNLIFGVATKAQVQADVRDYIFYEQNGSDVGLFKGVCNSTQSQDYTPALVSANKNYMVSASQVKALIAQRGA